MRIPDALLTRKAMITLLATAWLSSAALMLAGCGGSTGGSGELSQDFEKPAAPPAAVSNPPDSGDAQSPRDRRNP